MKCDVCGSTIRKAWGVYKNNLKAGRLKASQANLGICRGKWELLSPWVKSQLGKYNEDDEGRVFVCGDIKNICPRHGMFSSEYSQWAYGSGRICPECVEAK